MQWVHVKPSTLRDLRSEHDFCKLLACSSGLPLLFPLNPSPIITRLHRTCELETLLSRQWVLARAEPHSLCREAGAGAQKVRRSGRRAQPWHPMSLAGLLAVGWPAWGGMHIPYSWLSDHGCLHRAYSHCYPALSHKQRKSVTFFFFSFSLQREKLKIQRPKTDNGREMVVN